MAEVRHDEGTETQGVTMLELFYDLVLVLAVTQISHFLLEHLSWEGAGQSLLCLLVVWWSWNFTTWATNELDTESTQVRLLLIALMLATLLMAVAIPQAFGDRALLFVGSYVAIQIGRALFLTYVAADAGTIERRRAAHILAWFSTAAVFWLAGGFADGSTRTVLWLIALTIDYGGPLVTFRVPWMAPVDPEAWEVGTEHFAERFQLFVIIALGESIVITGTGVSPLELDAATVGALAVAFLGTAALWWLYFTSIADLTQRGLEGAERRTLVARDVYTYTHAVLIAGIIVAAVGDEVVIAEPTAELSSAELLAVVCGPVIYLLAQLALRLRMSGTLSKRRLAGVLGCSVAGLILSSAAALVVAGGVLAVLVALVVADQVVQTRRARRGESHPIESTAEAGGA
jgi:low temperature requirement protein LtrA